MKADYINPFIESVYDLFKTMLSSNVDRGDVGITNANTNSGEIVAIIGLSGRARGTVSLSFPLGTALKMASKLLGMEIRVVDDTVSDAVSELVNIVAGGAKAKFSSGTDVPIDLSLPTVVRGNSYRVEYPMGTIWMEVPFKSDLGDFVLKVTFEKLN